MKYTYPAIITPREGLYAVEFPDIEECVTCADTFPEAIFMAEDALALTLYGYEKTGKVKRILIVLKKVKEEEINLLIIYFIT